MIDFTLIRRFLSTANLSFSDFEKHGKALMNETQSFFNRFRGESVTSSELVNFDSFEFAWDRLTVSDRFRFVALAYRENKSMFGGVKFDDNIDWASFDLSQKAKLYSVACDALRVVVTLFSDEAFIANYKTGFIAAMREINRRDVVELRSVV